MVVLDSISVVRQFWGRAGWRPAIVRRTLVLCDGYLCPLLLILASSNQPTSSRCSVILNNWWSFAGTLVSLPVILEPGDF